MTDYERGQRDERARVRKIVSATAAVWAERAGVSIDALESWARRGMPDDGTRPRARKQYDWMIQIAAALIGVIDTIDEDIVT